LTLLATPEEDARPCPTCGLSPSSISELRSIISEQAEKIRELGEQVEELKRRLSVYENSNSPPSKNSLLYREMRRKRKEEQQQRQGAGGERLPPSKPGRKEGHEGVTQLFKPSCQVVHTMDRCPRCRSTRLSVTSTKTRTIVDVPEPLPYTVKEHVINTYRCSRCGSDNLIPESVGTELPSSSSVEETREGGVILGKNVLSTISMLWSVARLPLRKISYALESMYGLRLSPATIGHALEKVSEGLKEFQERVRKTVSRSKRANFDETGMPVGGRKGWVWVAATRRFAFVVVAMSRGREVLEIHFPDFRGIATVDGWRSYGFFAIIQRCWAHVLREAETLALRASGKGKDEAEALLSSLRLIFHETKSELKEHPPPNKSLHYRMLRRLRALLSRKEYTDADVLKFVSKVSEASMDLFTFTLHPRVEPTNNHAERQLREPIVQRKIRGQLKSESGMTIFGRLMTAVSTWKLQGLNPLAEFKRYV
jgi:transposase